MKKKFDRELTVEESAAMRDEDIDYSDIPALDEEFWNKARLIAPNPAKPR